MSNNNYKYSEDFTMMPMSAKLFHLRNIKADGEHGDYKITMYCDFDKSSEKEQRYFCNVLAYILEKNTEYIKPEKLSDNLQLAMFAGIIYKQKDTNEYRFTANQRQWANQEFPIDVFDEQGKLFEHKEIPYVDDSYDNKVLMTFKVKTQISTSRIYIDLVSVQFSDCKLYDKKKDVSAPAPSVMDFVDASPYGENNNLEVLEEDEIPF